MYGICILDHLHVFALATRETQRRDCSGRIPQQPIFELRIKTIKQLLIEKSVTSKSEIEGRVDEWRRAYLNTPHGMPISLAAAHSPLNHSLSTEDL